MDWTTKFRRFTAGCLTALTLIGSVSAWGKPETTNYPELEDEGVKARIAVGSDLHIGNNVGADERLRNAYEQFYKAAGDRLDAVAFVGDITNEGRAEQYDSLLEIVSEETHEGTETIYCMGNHEFYGNSSAEDSRNRFKEKTGQDINKSVEVNGVTVITLGAPDASGNYSSDFDFLKGALEAAAEKDPDAPIFVLAHHGVPDTAYVTNEWNGYYGEKMEQLLAKYPQVIHISGHSHSTLEDARSIDQTKGFTAIQDCTIGGNLENESGKVNPTTGEASTFPENMWDASAALMIEVSEDNVVTIRRMNLRTGCYMYEEEPWVIDTPAVVEDTGSFPYTGERSGNAPSFAEDAAVTVSDVGVNTLNVEFPAAIPASGDNNDMIHSYKITLTNTANQKTIVRSVFADYYMPTQKDTWNVKVKGLMPNTTYSVAVQAMTSFEDASDPIEMEENVTTGSAADVQPQILLDIDYSRGDVADKQGHEVYKAGEPELVSGQIEGSEKQALRLNGSSAYGYALSEEDFAKSSMSFTIEAYFKLDNVNGTHCIFSNQQQAGMGLEVNDGTLKLWCNLTTGLEQPSAPITANTWYHAVGTFDGTNLKFYLNGKEVYSQAFEAYLKVPDLSRYFVGADVEVGNVPGYFMQGYVNEARLYAGALSAAEVEKRYETVTAKEIMAAEPELLLDIDYSAGDIRDRKGHTATKVGTPEIVEGKIDGSTAKVLRLNGDGGIGYTLTDADYAKLSSNGFTIESYFKVDETQSDQCPFSNQQSAGMGLEVENNQFEFWCNLMVKGEKFNPKPTHPITADTWVHAAATYDGATLKLYWNGTEVYSETYVGYLTVPQPDRYYVGADPENGDNVVQAMMKGYTASAKLYAGALSAAEVAADYAAATKVVTPQGPSGNTSSRPAVPGSTALPFLDVNSSDWFFEDVAFVYKEGLMTGVERNAFVPDAGLTRAMLAEILYRMAGSPAVTENSAFADTRADAWYADAVAWAAQKGIVNGFGDGTFRPDALVTREQLTTMLWRYDGSTVTDTTDLDAFTDSTELSAFARDAMSWAVKNGILTGFGSSLRPADGANRAETAAMIHSYLQKDNNV